MIKSDDFMTDNRFLWQTKSANFIDGLTSP